MRYAHVCRDGYRVICSVEGCGERLGRIFEHPEYGGRVFEFADHMVFDEAQQVWRPTRPYQRRGVPFRRAPAWHRVSKAPRIGFDPSEIRLDVPLPRRAQRSQPLPAVARCAHGHLSEVDPDSLPIDVWFDHDGVLQRRDSHRASALDVQTPCTYNECDAAWARQRSQG
jgi:hypothetical protein